MYFLWKRTPLGSVRVSDQGLGDFLKPLLSMKSRLRGLSMNEGEEASVTLVLSSDVAEREDWLEARLSSIVAPLGLTVRTIWVDRGAPKTEWCETKGALYQSPWTWMLLVSMVTLVFKAGWNSLFWTMFWGTAAWFIARFVPALFRKKKQNNWNDALRR